MALIGRASSFQARELETEFRDCQEVVENSIQNNNDDNDHDTTISNHGLELLKTSPEFVVLDTSSMEGLIHFRLTGAKLYGYSEEEIERDLRIDTDAMNRDFVDAINASVDSPKAFLAYCHAIINGGERIALWYCGSGDPANNSAVLLREAKAVLATHFRNIQVCKCGT
jgi:hypothetical protein